MGLGTAIRLSRLFANPSGNLFGIAVDHFVSYGNVRDGGLTDLPYAVARCMQGHPDTMTMTPGKTTAEVRRIGDWSVAPSVDNNSDACNPLTEASCTT